MNDRAYPESCDRCAYADEGCVIRKAVTRIEVQTDQDWWCSYGKPRPEVKKR